MRYGNSKMIRGKTIVLYKKQRQRCAGCNQPFPLNRLTRNHRVRLSAGGRKGPSNWELLCGDCHRAADGHPPNVRLPAIGGECYV